MGVFGWKKSNLDAADVSPLIKLEKIYASIIFNLKYLIQRVNLISYSEDN